MQLCTEELVRGIGMDVLAPVLRYSEVLGLPLLYEGCVRYARDPARLPAVLASAWLRSLMEGQWRPLAERFLVDVAVTLSAPQSAGGAGAGAAAEAAGRG